MPLRRSCHERPYYRNRCFSPLFAVFWLLAVHMSPIAAVESEPGFVGSQACAACHQDEYETWRGSQHARAMQHATAETVLGDFENASFIHAGVESRFYRRDGRFYVWTDGADGKLAEFELRYTFGVEPLQQYLVEFPNGRLQALSIAWDSRLAEQGGQRWFHLYPHEQVTHKNPLHWTGAAQNWNFMCADCHSTDVRKHYDVEANRFSTTWAEISVGCESCHGPGARHLDWAREGSDAADKGLVLLFERRGSGWRASLEGLAARHGEPVAQREQEVCAQCHSRRAQIAEGYHAGKPLLDHYRPSLLEPGLYHADGQQRDEVFISASFAQSRMAIAGVTCGDCHEPHGQRLRQEGNALCSQCHVAQRYDNSEHHFHPQGSNGAQCVNCHMPEASYMVVDPRRDHSLRIPRPDLSQLLGTPNACNQCHSEQTPAWAAEQIRHYYPKPRTGLQTFAETFAAAEQGLPDALHDLAELIADLTQPPVVRASAAARLGPRADEAHWPALVSGLQDPDPQVRLASATALEGAPAPLRAEWLPVLLDDPLRVVRGETARLLADLPQRTTAQAHALEEYEAGLALHAERADSRVALAGLRQRQGRLKQARAELERALALEPLHLQARLNLADLMRGMGDDQQAAILLREGAARQPEAALLHYALGLTQVRLGQSEAARASLERAYRLSPEDGRIAYAHVLGLWPQRREQALEELERAVIRHPYDLQLRNAAAIFNWQAGRRVVAQGHARCLLALQPDSASARQLLGEGAEPGAWQSCMEIAD
jgi:predicted CXXCH cytochrome family protein